MYTFEEINETRKDEYNAVVAAQADAHVFQSWEWGEIKGWSGWIPHRYLINAGGDCAGGFQLLERPIKAIKSSVFYVPCGPAFDLADTILTEEFALFIKNLAKKRKAIFVKVDPAISDDRQDIKDSLAGAGFDPPEDGDGAFEGIQPRCVMHLDIRGTADEVLGRMTEKWRYNIRLAARKGVTVRLGETTEDISAFYKILQVTGKRDGFLIRSEGYFRKMYEVMAPAGMMRLFIADYNGQPISATIALMFAGRCWYVYGASGNEFRNVMPNHALQWAMIQWAKEGNCPVYDFRGVPCDLSPEHPLHGLVRFKTGFGAYPVKYIGEYGKTFRPAAALAHKYGMPAYTKLRKLLRK